MIIKRIILFFYYRVLKFYNNIKIKFGLVFPKRVSVELTTYCNLNCPFCLVGQQNSQKSVKHSDLPREFGYITAELYNKIINEAKVLGMKEVLLTFQGEPLLHKQIAEFIQTAKMNNLKTYVFTNGMLLKPDLIRKLMDAGIDSIRFSVDGASEKIYQINRVGGKFSTVYNNMKEASKIAKEYDRKIDLIWQFIVFKNNEHEISLGEKLAKEIDIKFELKTFAESVPELIPYNPVYRRKMQKKPCTDIYRSMWIYWNGDVVPCCYDLSGLELMGNAKENTLKEIWDGSKFKNFRKRIANIKKNPEFEPKLCRSCLKWISKEKKK